MADFSPGPWVIAQPWCGFSEVRDAEGRLVFGLAAGTRDEKQPDDVCDANGRLIAGATDLHAVVVELLDNLVEAMRFDGWPLYEIERRPEILRARSVLAAIAGVETQ